MSEFNVTYWFRFYLHNTTVPKMKIMFTARESENPTIQMEEGSNFSFCDILSVKIKKTNLDYESNV